MAGRLGTAERGAARRVSRREFVDLLLEFTVSREISSVSWLQAVVEFVKESRERDDEQNDDEQNNDNHMR